jgi:hypothetical protein
MTLAEDDGQASLDPDIVHDDHDERELLEQVKGKVLSRFSGLLHGFGSSTNFPPLSQARLKLLLLALCMASSWTLVSE